MRRFSVWEGQVKISFHSEKKQCKQQNDPSRTGEYPLRALPKIYGFIGMKFRAKPEGRHSTHPEAADLEVAQLPQRSQESQHGSMGLDVSKTLASMWSSGDQNWGVGDSQRCLKPRTVRQ